MKIILTVLMLVAATFNLYASPLSTAVANCPVGQFCKVNMSNLTTATLDSTNGGTITAYSSKAAWDNVNNRFYFVGSGHLECTRFVTYDDASDNWTSVIPPWAPCPNPGTFFYHTYQHSTFDPIAQRYYARHYGEGIADVYDVASKSWSVTSTNAQVGTQVSGGFEYFPDMKKVLHFGDANGVFGELWAYSPVGNSWSQIGLSDTYVTGSYDQFAVYSTANHAVIFGGGGSSNLFKVDAMGAITQLNSSSFEINDATAGGTITTADPVSGNLLVIDGGGSIHELDLTSNPKGNWGVLSVKAPFVDASPGNGVYGVVAAQMQSYGVVGFLVCGGVAGCSGNNSPQFYIYKHKQGSGVYVPPVASAPAAPKNLVVK